MASHLYWLRRNSAKSINEPRVEEGAILASPREKNGVKWDLSD